MGGSAMKRVVDLVALHRDRRRCSGPARRPSSTTGTLPVAAAGNRLAAGARARHLPAAQRRLHDGPSTASAGWRASRPSSSSLAAAGRTPLLVLAGDFLSPSVASSVFKGEQMIAALNAAGLDIATLGNHEFDFGDDMLIQRMARSHVAMGGLERDRYAAPTSRSAARAPYLVKTFGALKVGFIGLCLTTDEISPDKLTHTRIVDPLDRGRAVHADAEARGRDRHRRGHASGVRRRPRAGRAVSRDRSRSIGGHEHYPITATENRTFISKAGSDAKCAGAHRRQSARRRRGRAVLRADAGHAAHPRRAAHRGGRSRLRERGSAPSSKSSSATTRVPLDAHQSHLRAAETNLGNLIADAMRAEAGADIAIMNAGSIRGDRIYPAGPLTPPHAARDASVRQRRRQDVDAGPRRAQGAERRRVAKLPAAAGSFRRCRDDDDGRSGGAGRATGPRRARRRPAARAGPDVHGRASPTTSSRAATATRCSPASRCWSARRRAR